MAKATAKQGDWYWQGSRVYAGDEVEASEAQLAAWAEDGVVLLPEDVEPEAAPEPESETQTALEAASEPGVTDAATRPDDPEALPPGYLVEHTGGGYFALTAAGERTIKGPSNGKWQGKAAAADAAWADYENAHEG